MLANAMWYQAAPEAVPTGLQFGPIIMSGEQIYIGIMSNLITLVPTLVIVFFFRKARRRKLRKNRYDTTI